jgi:hypothetical protein
VNRPVRVITGPLQKLRTLLVVFIGVRGNCAAQNVVRLVIPLHANHLEIRSHDGRGEICSMGV